MANSVQYPDYSNINNQVNAGIDGKNKHKPLFGSIADIQTLLNQNLNISTISKSAHTSGKKRTDIPLHSAAPTLEAPSSSFQELSPESMEVLSNIAATKTAQSRIQSMEDNLKSLNLQQSRENQINDQKIVAAAKKMAEAHRGGLIGEIIGWIITAIVVVVAVALTVLTEGAAAPLLAMALLGGAVMLDNSTGGHVIGLLADVFAKCLEACGVDKKKAETAGKWCALVTEIVVMIALTVATGGMSTEADAEVLAPAINEGVQAGEIGEDATTGAEIGGDSSQNLDRTELTLEIEELQEGNEFKDDEEFSNGFREMQEAPEPNQVQTTPAEDTTEGSNSSIAAKETPKNIPKEESTDISKSARLKYKAFVRNSNTKTVAGFLKTGDAWVQASGAVLQGIFGITTGVEQYHADMLHVDSLQIQAIIKQAQANMDIVQSSLKDVINNYKSSMERTATNINNTAQAKSAIYNITLS